MENQKTTKNPEEYLIHFLVKTAIPVIKENSKESNRTKDAIYRANRDVMTGFRTGNLNDYKDQMQSIVNRLTGLCEKKCDGQNKIGTDDLLPILIQEFPRVKIGALQKLVNMTLKYFIILKELEGAAVPIVEWERCDCPLDSYIINSISKDINNDFKNKKVEEKKKSIIKDGDKTICWTKLDDANKYKEIQDYIGSKQLTPFGKLTYDFDNWKE